MLAVLLEPRAQRELEEVPSPYRERMIEAFERLGLDPLGGKPLNGRFRGCRSYRVGDYRVIYRVQADQGRVLVGHIAHRREVYR